MIYIDHRRLSVQGTNVPHGGGYYTNMLTESLLAGRPAGSVQPIETDSQLSAITENDTFWSASAYDLMYRTDIPGEKKYVIHGLRDLEINMWGEAGFLHRAKFALKQRLKAVPKSLLSEVHFIFPSIVTKHMFELLHGGEVTQYSIMAAPGKSLSDIPYTSRLPSKKFEPSRKKGFVFLSADRDVKNFSVVEQAMSLVRNVYDVNWAVLYTSKAPLTSDPLFSHEGYVSRNDLRKLLQNNILLFPSFSEGYGLPAIDSTNIAIISGSLTLSWEHMKRRIDDAIFVNPKSKYEVGAAMILAASSNSQEKLSSTFASSDEQMLKLVS